METRLVLTSDRGASLIDMMVTLIIFGIVSAVAVPQFANLAPSFERANAQSLFLYDLRRAHAETVTEGCRGIMTINVSGTSYTFGCDYLGYDASDPPAPDSVSFTRQLPDGIVITASDQIIFNSKGQAVDATNALASRTVWFWDTNGSSVQFASGQLLPTGMFVFD